MWSMACTVIRVVGIKCNVGGGKGRRVPERVPRRDDGGTHGKGREEETKHREKETGGSIREHTYRGGGIRAGQRHEK
jgi:hypothetical protein